MLPAYTSELVSSAIADGALFGGGIVRTDGLAPVWHVTTEVHPSTLELFRSHSEEAVVTSDVIGIRPGWVCWVVAFDVFGVQHRLFLPLFGSEVGDFTRRAKRSSARLLLDAAGAETVLQVRIPLSAGLRAALREHWRPSVDLDFYEESLLLTAASLLAPSALAAAEGVSSPSEVSVSAVLPGEFSLDSAGEAATALWRTFERRKAAPH
jgi:hypothetical protein